MSWHIKEEGRGDLACKQGLQMHCITCPPDVFREGLCNPAKAFIDKDTNTRWHLLMLARVLSHSLLVCTYCMIDSNHAVTSSFICCIYVVDAVRTKTVCSTRRMYYVLDRHGADDDSHAFLLPLFICSSCRILMMTNTS
jgi:hypothetical protein